MKTVPEEISGNKRQWTCLKMSTLEHGLQIYKTVTLDHKTERPEQWLKVEHGMANG